MARNFLSPTFLTLSLLLAACSMDSGGTRNTQTVSQTSEVAKDSPVSFSDLSGEWRIAAIDGQLPQGKGTTLAPTIMFGENFYGGSAGCNALGGLVVMQGNRLFTVPGPPTVMLCSPGLMVQETVWDAVLRSNPVVEILAPGKLRLSGGGHSLDLSSKQPLNSAKTSPPLQLAGTAWSLRDIDGQTFPQQPSRGTLGRLSFSADSWTASDGCRTMTGNYRQQDKYIVANAAKLQTSNTSCAGTSGNAFAALTAMMQREVAFAVGLNGELLMAGNGHRLIGEQNRQAVARPAYHFNTFDLRGSRYFSNYIAVVGRFLRQHSPHRRAQACVVGVNVAGQQNETAWVIWRGGDKLILWWGGGDDDLNRSNRLLSLRRDVVENDTAVGASTYLVSRPWVTALERACAQSGRYVTVN